MQSKIDAINRLNTIGEMHKNGFHKPNLLSGEQCDA